MAKKPVGVNGSMAEGVIGFIEFIGFVGLTRVTRDELQSEGKALPENAGNPRCSTLYPYKLYKLYERTSPSNPTLNVLGGKPT
jgi:hypothetical protein